MSRPLASLVGIGATPFVKAPGVEPLVLAAQAYRDAVTDGGIDPATVDGLVMHGSASHSADLDQIAWALGLKVRYGSQPWGHGMWSGTLIAEAIGAIHAGLASRVLVICNFSHTSPLGVGGRFGANDSSLREGFREGGAILGHVPHTGLTAPVAAAAMLAQRYLYENGYEPDDLSPVAVALRFNASLNPSAGKRERITVDDHRKSPWVVRPLRRLDCCLVNDGAAAVIVTAPDDPLVGRENTAVNVLATSGLRLGPGRHPFGGNVISWYSDPVGEPKPQTDVFDAAGVGPEDMDAVYTYDAFTSVVPVILEQYGYVAAGDGLGFARDGALQLGGKLPLNTNGGLHSEGHSLGWGCILEMVRQLRAQCGDRQVEGARMVHWAPPFGNAVILGT